MSNITKWRSNWSLYWKDLEDQYFNIDAVKKILDDLISPVLIIGAGRGLICKFLKDKGFIVEGIDDEDKMIIYAKKRHKINLIKADASDIPFEDNYFNTVIISSGVLDYSFDNDYINKVLREALRVTSIQGNLFIAFYQKLSKLDNFFKNAGVIQSGTFYMKRLFDIYRLSDINPLKCVMPISKWTKKNILKVLFFWMSTGFKVPHELTDEKNKILNILNKASNENNDADQLLDSVPDKIPYRDENLIKDMLLDQGFLYNGIDRFNECTVIRIFKSAFLTYKLKGINEKKTVQSVFSGDYALKIDNLIMKYKNAKANALNNLSFCIRKGQIFGLLGPNGAGKTTTLSIICGLVKPTSGSVTFAFKNPDMEIKKKLGVVPQDVSLFMRLTARENLTFFGNLYKIPNNKLHKKVDELLYLVGLSDRSNELIINFSIGMKRRLNFAVGLVNDPEIVLMDEPTVGIDPQSRNKIYQLVFDLKEKGSTVIYTTHYIEEANKLCDYVAIMDYGRIITSGTPHDVVDKFCFLNLVYKIEKKISSILIDQLKKIKFIIDVSVRNDELLITSSGFSDKVFLIDRINSIVKKTGSKLSLLKIVEPSLEGLFLDITGKNLRDMSE